jgi:hypothetical protein
MNLITLKAATSKSGLTRSKSVTQVISRIGMNLGTPEATKSDLSAQQSVT